MILLNQPPVGSQIIEKRVEIKAIEGEIRSIEAQIKKVGRCDQQRLLEKRTELATELANLCDELVCLYQQKDDTESAKFYSDKANQTRRRMRGEP